MELKLRDVFIALNRPVFFVLNFGFFQLVSRIPYGVFRFANSIARLAFGLFRQTLSLGFIVTGPLAYLALHASGNVFGFPFNAFLIHK